MQYGINSVRETCRRVGPKGNESHLTRMTLAA